MPLTDKPIRSGGVLTKTFLSYDEGAGGDPILWALNKATGEAVAKIDWLGSVTLVPMTYINEGKQYTFMVLIDVTSSSKIRTLALPD